MKGVNRSNDTSTNGAQCAQCCAVISSVCVMLFTQLVTLRCALLGMCMKLYTLFRSLLSYKYVREFLVQDVLYLQESCRVPRTFASFSGFLVKFWFCTNMPGSIEWLSPAPRLHIGDCFETRNCH